MRRIPGGLMSKIATHKWLFLRPLRLEFATITSSFLEDKWG